MMGAVPLTNICGKVNILGKNDEDGNTVFGKLDLNSVNYGDYQLTDVKGPFSFHGNEILLGSGAWLPGFVEQSPAWRQTSMNTSTEFAPIISQAIMTSPRGQVTSLQPEGSNPLWLLALTVAPNRVENDPIIASAYDGTVWLEGRVFQQESMLYNLQTGLYEVNLERLTRETLAEHPFKGKLSGAIELDGGMSRDSMKGNGRLALREADIYKLPTMQRIMEVIGVRSRGNEQSAICSSDIEFSLLKNDVTLSDVRLEGNILSLSGTGTVKLDSMTISLDLGSQLTSRIHVEGSLRSGDMSVRPTALPGLRNALLTQPDGQQSSRPVRDFFRYVGSLNPITR
jgi:hypothetical protein